jgi:hypothetical protein
MNKEKFRSLLQQIQQNDTFPNRTLDLKGEFDSTASTLISLFVVHHCWLSERETCAIAWQTTTLWTMWCSQAQFFCSGSQPSK